MKLTLCFGKTNNDANVIALGEIKNLVSVEKTYIVVPDRASLITELMSLDKLGISGAMNFRVLTINTLANMVLEEERPTLSSFGGSLLVKKILKDEKQNLVCFNRISSNMNFASEMYKLIQQLKSSNLSPAQLDINSPIPDGTKLKARDIKLIWTNYEKEINENFSDGFSRLGLFREQIKTSDVIRGSNFVFLYAAGYTNQILDIVCEISKFAKKTVVALPKPLPEQQNADIYFAEAENFFKDFSAKSAVELEKKFSPEDSDIKTKLFSFTLGDKKQKNSRVHLFQSQNEIDEVSSCCNFILDKVQGGASFSDFNVIMASSEHYEKVLERALIRNKIPHFFDRQIEISSHALSKFIISMINCFYFDLQSQFVLELSKSYYLDLSPEQISNFENYVYKYGVEGGMFLSNFFDENAEQVREKLQFIFENYKLFKAGKTADVLIDIISQVLAEVDVENKNIELAKALEDVGDFENAKITAQIFEKVSEVFGDVALIFKNKQVEPYEIREMLISGIKSKTISLVPIKTKSVYVGDIASSYFSPDKTNIVLGASFGAFPSTIKDVGIISDDEIKFLKLNGRLEPTIKQLNEREMFRCFELCADANELVLSFAKNVEDENKTESLASVDLKNIFDINLENWPMNENIMSAPDANIILFGNAESASVGRTNFKFQNNEIAITSLEKYFDCPLKFTLLGQVKIKERESGIAKAFDIGNIYHEFMFFLMKQIDKINEKNLEAKSREIIDKVLTQDKYSVLLEVRQNTLIIKNIKKECVKLAKVALFHQEHSAFKANKNLLEVSFGNGEKLCAPHFEADGKNYYLKGKIDRVDTAGDMARVIDYKTGSDEFNLADVFYGKKIQLLSYASCLEENGYRVAGAYYFPLKNEYKGKNYIHKLDGITLKDLDVVHKLDLNLSAGKKSNLINVGITQDGNFHGGVGKNTLFSEKQMREIVQYVKKLSAGATHEIDSGFAEAWPLAKQENKCSCDYCPFKNSYFCIDAKKRKMKSISKENFFGEKEDGND